MFDVFMRKKKKKHEKIAIQTYMYTHWRVYILYDLHEWRKSYELKILMVEQGKYVRD